MLQLLPYIRIVRLAQLNVPELIAEEIRKHLYHTLTFQQKPIHQVER
jgi:hypothetical protein